MKEVKAITQEGDIVQIDDRYGFALTILAGTNRYVDPGAAQLLR